MARLEMQIFAFLIMNEQQQTNKQYWEHDVAKTESKTKEPNKKKQTTKNIQNTCFRLLSGGSMRVKTYGQRCHR